MLLDGTKLIYYFYDEVECEEFIKKYPHHLWENWDVKSGVRREWIFVDEKKAITITTVKRKSFFETLTIFLFERTETMALNNLEKKSYFLILTGTFHGNYNKRICEKKGTWISQNYQQITLTELKTEILRVCKELQLDATRFKLAPSEFGLNIYFNKNVSEFIERDVVLHKTKEEREKYTDFAGKEFYNSSYVLKIYDKGAQFSLDHALLRIELSFNESKVVKAAGIETVLDACDPEKLKKLLKYLLAKIDDLLIYDSNICLDSLSLEQEDRQLLHKGSQEKHFWNDLLKKDRNRFYRDKRRFKELVSIHGINWNERLKELVVEEFNKSILEVGKQIEKTKMATLKTTDREIESSSENNYGTGMNDVFVFNTALNNINIRGMKEKKIRTCLTCGNDISHQRPNSRFCGEKFYGRKAKTCRNKVSNKKNNLKRKRNTSKKKSELATLTGIDYLHMIRLKRQVSVV